MSTSTPPGPQQPATVVNDRLGPLWQKFHEDSDQTALLKDSLGGCVRARLADDRGH